MYELKRCPFCGGTELNICKAQENYYYVECTTKYCRTLGPGRSTKRRAVDAWNKRS